MQVEENDEEETYCANLLLIVTENVYRTVTSNVLKAFVGKTGDRRFSHVIQ